jgi:hypothetical protein
MTRDEYMKLRCGDVILWKFGNSTMRRTIIEGPGDHDDPRKQCITIPIRRRSWTGRGTTVYCYNDVKGKVVGKLSKRQPLLANKEEIFSLLNWHIHPSQLIARELKDCARNVSQAITKAKIMKAAIRTHAELKGVGL